MKIISAIVKPATVFLITLVVASCFMALVVWFGVGDTTGLSADTADYMYAANGIVNGRYVSTPGYLIGKGFDELYRYYRTPGFPLWLIITGHNQYLGPLYAALLALIAYAIVVVIGGNRNFAMVVGLLTGLSPTTLFLSPFLLSDLPAAILVTLGVLLVLVRYHSADRKYIVLSAVAIGIAALFRPSSLAYAVVPAVALLINEHVEVRRRVVSAALFGAVLFATIAPWMMNVYRNTGMFKLSTQGSFAVLTYTAHYSRVGGMTNDLAKVHIHYKPIAAELVRNAINEQDRVRIEWEETRRIAMENPVKFIVGALQTAIITIVTPSKDVVGLFPNADMNRWTIRVPRAVLSAVFTLVWMFGLVDLCRNKATIVAVLTLSIIMSVALSCFAGSVMGQRVMLPSLFVQNFLFVWGAVRVFEKAALVEWWRSR